MTEFGSSWYGLKVTCDLRRLLQKEHGSCEVAGHLSIRPVDQDPVSGEATPTIDLFGHRRELFPRSHRCAKDHVSIDRHCRLSV